MVEEVAALNVRLEATVAKFEAGMRRAEASMRRSTNRIERDARQLDRRLERVGERFGVNIPTRAIAAATAIALIGKATTEVIRNGDKVKLLEARFRALTGSAERGEQAFQELLRISSEVGVSLDGAASAMTRFTIAGDNINATDDEVARLTESILKLGTIGGATTQEITAGSQQLGQALARGVLNGDELRSVLENMPLVAKAIADGLGVGVGQLRAMGEAGELTARKVFDAILGKTVEIDRKFGELPVTVDRAATRMANAWIRVTSQIDEATGASQKLVAVLNGVAGALERIAAGPAPQAMSMANLRSTQAARDALLRAYEGTENPIARRNILEQLRSLGIGANATFFGDEPGFGVDTGALATTAPIDPLSVLAMQGNYAAYGGGRSTGYQTPLGGGRGGGGGVAAQIVIPPAVVEQSIQAMERYVQTLVDQRGEIGLSGVALAEYRAKTETARMVQELETRAREEGVAITAEQRAQIDALAASYEFLSVEIERQNQALDEAARKAQNAQTAMDGISNAITQGVQQAENFSEALKKIGLNLANLALQGLFGQGPAGGFFNDAFGVAGNGILGLLFSAKGNAFGPSGRIHQFASGGVVNNATPFQFGNGNLGVMGEAGPEAILPLKRGPGGRLGVEASGARSIVFGDTHVTIKEPGATYEEVVRAVVEGQRRTLAHIDERRRLDGDYLGA